MWAPYELAQLVSSLDARARAPAGILNISSRAQVHSASPLPVPGGPPLQAGVPSLRLALNRFSSRARRRVVRRQASPVNSLAPSGTTSPRPALVPTTWWMAPRWRTSVDFLGAGAVLRRSGQTRRQGRLLAAAESRTATTAEASLTSGDKHVRRMRRHGKGFALVAAVGEVLQIAVVDDDLGFTITNSLDR